MFYTGADGLLLRRVVFSDEEKTAVLNEAHAGHFGRDRMMHKIRQRFYWHSITADVDNWVCELKLLTNKDTPIVLCVMVVIPNLYFTVLFTVLFYSAFNVSIPLICHFVTKVSTCEPCQRFEKVKTEPPELKPIKPVAPWHMIGKTALRMDL